MKSPDPIITVDQWTEAIFVASIVWRGCVIRPAEDANSVRTYTTNADALRGARRALRRLGYVDLWTDTDKRRKAAK